MRKAVGVILLIFVVSLVVYAFFFSTAKNRVGQEIGLISEDNMHKIVSIKQIDSLSADLNYEFTIRNKVIHPVSTDSLQVPRKGENPSG